MNKEETLHEYIDTLNEGEEFWICEAMEEYAKKIAIDYEKWIRKSNIPDEKLYEQYLKSKQ